MFGEEIIFHSQFSIFHLNGEIRPNVKTHFFPPPFDAKLSLLPRLNWGLLPNGGESACQM